MLERRTNDALVATLLCLTWARMMSSGLQGSCGLTVYFSGCAGRPERTGLGCRCCRAGHTPGGRLKALGRRHIANILFLPNGGSIPMNQRMRRLDHSCTLRSDTLERGGSLASHVEQILNPCVYPSRTLDWSPAVCVLLGSIGRSAIAGPRSGCVRIDILFSWQAIRIRRLCAWGRRAQGAGAAHGARHDLRGLRLQA